MTDLEPAPVVTCFLRNGCEVLLLRRSKRVGSYRGRWGGVAGYVESDGPERSALREIAEETNVRGELSLVRRGEPFLVDDEELGKRWSVHPFLFDVSSREIDLDWESVEAEWAHPTEILRRDVVPELWTSYRRVAPTFGSIREDRTHGAAYLSLRALEVLRDRAGELAAASEIDAPRARRELASIARGLAECRPSMAAIRNRVLRFVSESRSEDQLDAVEGRARLALARAIEADERASEAAAGLVRGERVLTLSRSATVLQALVRGAPARVVVAESGPGREGVATARSLAAAGLPVSLVADSALADAARRHDVSLVLVGADAVLPAGDVVNKTGTHLAALVAKERNAPFFAVAATDKIAAHGEVDLEREEHGVADEGLAPEVDVEGFSFEVTPAALVTGIVTERGRLGPEELRPIVEELRALGTD